MPAGGGGPSGDVRHGSAPEGGVPQLPLRANLVSLLNDPTPEGRRENQSIYTKTWGEAWAKPVLTPHPAIPRVSRADFDKYLTRIYGENPYRQKPLGRPLAPEPVGLPDVGDDDGARDPAAVRRRIEEATKAISDALADLPQEIFAPDFRLTDERTFEAMLRVDEHLRLEAEGRALFLSSCKLHQEKLSHHLDIVEMQLARQISLRSGAFFGAMRSQDDLYDEVERCCLEIHQLRRRLAEADGALVVSALDIPSMLRRGMNLRTVNRKLRLMASVHQTQPTIQLLLASADYVRALDLIAGTQEVLETELAGIHCFRHMGSQLTEMARVVGAMIESDFLSFALECVSSPGLGRVLDEAAALAAVESHVDRFRDRIAPVVQGLLHTRRQGCLSSYRDGVHSRIKLAIKEAVSNYLASINEDSSLDAVETVAGEEKKASLTEQMRQLGFRHWLQMLSCVYAVLGDALVGLRAVHAIIVSVVGVSVAAPAAPARVELPRVVSNGDLVQANGRPAAGPGADAHVEGSHAANSAALYTGEVLEGDELIAALANSAPPAMQSSKPMPAAENENAASANGAPIPEAVALDQPSDYSDRVRMLRDSDELLASAVELAHTRCSKLLGVRSNQMERLSSVDFVDFFRTCDSFIAASEAVSRRSGLGLRGALLSQAKRFMVGFHEQRVAALLALLREERWVAAEVAPELQAVVDRPADLLTREVAHAAGIAIPVRSAESARPSGFLRVQGRDFRVAGCALFFLKMVTEYCECVAGTPALSVDVMGKLCALLKLFNAETCKLILGGGVGLKTITAKHLALTVQCLSAVVAQIPVIRALLSSKLPERQRVMLAEVDRISKDYSDHAEQIRRKIVTIMSEVFASIVKDFRLTDDQPPSGYMRTLVRETTKLHKVLQDLLSPEDMRLVFSQVFALYNAKLQEAYSKIDLRQVVLQKRVNADVRYFIDSLSVLGGGIPGPGNDLMAFCRTH